MSSIDIPSHVLHSPPSVEEDVDHSEDDIGQSTTAYSSDLSEATNTDVDENFLDNHLRSPPSFSYTVDMLPDIERIQDSVNEDAMYRPAAALLTGISKMLYNSLSSDKKTSLRTLHKVPQNKPGHLSFIDHHTSPPTHFPSSVLGPVEDKPDLIGVYNVEDFGHTNGVYTKIPHHRVEAIVEAKPKSKSGGRQQATTYAYRHHQARPDHPGVYCLVVKPQWYQVLYSDPSGVFASAETKWSEPRLLAAYVYSHYYPPRDHFLHDETITWTTSSEGDGRPVWSIKTNGKEYMNCRFLFIGDAWGRRTMVFVGTENGAETASEYPIKESYRHYGRRYKEEELLAHIHAAGDVPGVVRLRSSEHVVSGGKRVQCGTKDEKTLRAKERFVFLDSGDRLSQAESVNDLLKAVYDAIEVHRVLFFDRKVLHRDMSIYNILMYPKWAKVEGRRVMKNPPPFITDVLTQQLRPDAERIPCCLVIDLDNGAPLNDKTKVASEELTARTGTPMYIARSVCLGGPILSRDTMYGAPMPELEGEALDLYIRAYGKEHYARYLDQNGTVHGGEPPSMYDPRFNPRFARKSRKKDQKDHPNKPSDGDDDDANSKDSGSKFYHRPEHDLESIYWSMVSALLRAQPISAPMELFASKGLALTWEILHTHQILNNPEQADDLRSNILGLDLQGWEAHFGSEMQDVAGLLCYISEHVTSEYALWKGNMIADHLHEAVQRLILQYLVDHRDNPIPLDPCRRRPTKGPSARVKNELNSTQQQSNQVTASGSGAGTHLKHGTGRMSQRASKGSGRGRGSGTRMKMSIRQSNSKPSAAVAGPSTSRQTRTSSQKRKSESEKQPGRSSKRRKGASGAAVPTEEDDDSNDV